MFYLTTHSRYFIYGYMVKDHTDSERRNPLPPLHGLLFPIRSGQSVLRANSEQAVVEHTSHGHRCLHSLVPLSGTGRECMWGDEGAGAPAMACTREYKQSDAGSVAGGGCYGGMKFDMSRGIKPKRKYMCISVKEIGRNLDYTPKGKKGVEF